MAWITLLNSEITIRHKVRNAAGDAYVSGESANIVTGLLDPDGDASALVVTITEIGVTGLYNIKFTPDEDGIWLLTATNPAGTDEAVYEYDVIAGSVAATALSTDAYCAESDVVAIAQYTDDFTASTTPTESQLFNFMARRAAILYSDIRAVLGSAAPGPDNYNVKFTGSTDAEVALERVLIHFNAIGAAIDTLEAAGAGESPGRSERIAELYTMWSDRDDELRMAAKMYQTSSTTSATHISVGEITKSSVSSREEDGLMFTGTTTW